MKVRPVHKGPDVNRNQTRQVAAWVRPSSCLEQQTTVARRLIH